MHIGRVSFCLNCDENHLVVTVCKGMLMTFHFIPKFPTSRVRQRIRVNGSCGACCCFWTALGSGRGASFSGHTQPNVMERSRISRFRCSCGVPLAAQQRGIESDRATFILFMSFLSLLSRGSVIHCLRLRLLSGWTCAAPGDPQKTSAKKRLTALV